MYLSTLFYFKKHACYLPSLNIGVLKSDILKSVKPQQQTKINNPDIFAKQFNLGGCGTKIPHDLTYLSQSLNL